MDNQHAIALLRRMQEPEAYEPQITAEAFEALDMAIKALEQASFPQRHENDHLADGDKMDCISRRAAIDVLSQYPFEKVVNCLSILEELPSAQTQYEELTPEEAASEIASGSTMSAWYWLDDMIRLKRMGYVICRKR